MFDPNLCQKKYLYNNNNKNDNSKNKQISSSISTPLHSDYVENNEAQSKFNESIALTFLYSTVQDIIGFFRLSSQDAKSKKNKLLESSVIVV